MNRREAITNAIAGTAAVTAAAVMPIKSAEAQSCASVCYPQTPAESAAGVIPANYSFPTLNVMRYGAVGNGATDDAPAFSRALRVAQQLIKPNIAYPWGTVCIQIPPSMSFAISSVTIPTGCGLSCDGGIAYLIAAAPSGVMIDTPVVEHGTRPIYNILVRNIYLHGAGSNDALVGLRINNCQGAVVENCRFDNFSSSAVSVQSKFDGFAYAGSATSCDCYFRDVRAFQCVLNTELSSRTGTFNVMGSDHEFVGCEAFNAMGGSMSGANKFRVGWNLVGVNESRFVNCKGSAHDQGWHVDENCLLNFFSNLRADCNFAEGIFIDGCLHWFENIDLNSNSEAATNTYDHVVMSERATRNHIASGSFNCNVNASCLTRFCITDNNKSAGVPNRAGPMLLFKDIGTAAINNAGGALSVMLAEGVSQTLEANSPAPSVTNDKAPLKNWKTSNSLTTRITNFTDGCVGQVICIEGGDPNTTIAHGQNIRTLSGADIPMAGNALAQFRLNSNSVWTQF